MVEQQGIENLRKEAYVSKGINPVEYAGLIKWQLESEDILERTYYWLQGLELVQNEKGEWEYQRLSKRYCNKEGASAIISMLSMYLNKTITLSNFSEKRINAIMLELGNSFISFLAYWQPKYEIDPGDLNVIKNTILDMIEANFWRAYDMETFKGQQASHHSVEEYKKEKEKSKLPFPGFLKGGK